MRNLRKGSRDVLWFGRRWIESNLDFGLDTRDIRVELGLVELVEGINNWGAGFIHGGTL